MQTSTTFLAFFAFFIGLLFTTVEADDSGAPLCNIRGWGAAYLYTIDQGISYLYGLADAAVVPPGCTRVSCSKDSAIYACNDNSYTVKPTGSQLGSLADAIVEACATKNLVTGQVFDFGDGNGNNQFNVLIKSDNC